MASNKELITSITELDADAKTDGLSNKQLADLLKKLKSETTAGAEAAAKAKEEAKNAKPKKAKLPPFSLAKGKAITTKRGILSDGAEIKEEDLAGGADALAAFVKSGYVVKA